MAGTPDARGVTGPAALDEIEGRLDDVIRAYDAQGWHRTGTDTDRASAEWLAGLVRACGVEAVLEPFPLSRLDPGDCYVEAGGRRFAGVPFYDGGLTDAAGASGRLVELGGDGEIGLAENPPNSHGETPVNRARRDGRYRALVAVARGRAPGLALTNAPDFLAPFGPPVLQVSSEDGPYLLEQARNGASVRVIARASRTEAEAFNVIASIRGREAELPPLVITTPRSGWWHCAGERGGGLACWLETVRALAGGRPARDVLFAAFSGHELGPLGVTMFLRVRPDLAPRAHAWIHFGANIGAARDAAVRFSAVEDGHRRMLADAFLRAGVAGAVAAPPGAVVGAESAVVASEGGRAIALVGGNALFHLEADRYPAAVEIGALARQATACVEVARALAGAAPS